MTCAPTWWSTWAIRQAVLVIDETGFLKKGTKSVGVARQYCGTAGRIENCQIGVFLAYASPRGHAFLDRALYLPKAWAEDAARREEAGIPPEVGFATKGELAQTMLARAFAAEVPAAWVTGDEVYGNDGDLRRWLEGEQRPYVLAVARSHPVWHAGAQVRVDALVAQIPAGRLAAPRRGGGQQRPAASTTGPVPGLPYCDRGRAGPVAADPPLGQRSGGTGLLSRLWPRGDATLAELAQVAGTRWTIEEGFQRAKEIGLDQYEVRRWAGWHRHITLCLLAHAFLEVTRAAADREKGGRAQPDPAHRPGGAALAGRCCPARSCPARFRLHWSRWRRKRQAEARRSHYQRRLARSALEVPL